jgi:predicted transposase/invertase (TIGR01784 family)
MSKLNPKIDLVFKKIFGTEHNKNVLKSLINAVLPEKEQVTELFIKNPYNEKEFSGDKFSVVDIKATDENGTWYDIEIQIKEQKFYGKRAIFYHSEIYGNQLGEGDSYEKLHKTIIISLLDYNYFLKDNRFFRRCSYKDFDTGEFYDELDYADLYFVEMRKHDNELKNVKTALERWVSFLNKATEYGKENFPDVWKEPEILQAFETIETMSLSSKERDYYEAEKKVMRDRDAEFKTALEKEVKKVVGEAVEKAHEEAVEKRNVEIAENSIKSGLSNEVIQIITGLELNQINEIRKKISEKG